MERLARLMEQSIHHLAASSLERKSLAVDGVVDGVVVDAVAVFDEVVVAVEA